MSNFVTQPYGDGLTDGQWPNSFLGKETQASICHSTIKRDGTTDSPIQRTEPTCNQVGEKGAALQTAQPKNGCCYTGVIAYPKSWYDCLLTLQTANPEMVVLYGSDRLPQELVRSFTTPNKRHYLQKQLGRLP